MEVRAIGVPPISPEAASASQPQRTQPVNNRDSKKKQSDRQPHQAKASADANAPDISAPDILPDVDSPPLAPPAAGRIIDKLA